MVKPAVRAHVKVLLLPLKVFELSVNCSVPTLQTLRGLSVWVSDSPARIFKQPLFS